MVSKALQNELFFFIAKLLEFVSKTYILCMFFVLKLKLARLKRLVGQAHDIVFRLC